MTNLIVAYDLIEPGQNYEAVTAAIRALGPWYKLQYSLFYVQAKLSAEQAYDRIRPLMDQNDKLVVSAVVEMVFGQYPRDDIAALERAWAVAA